MKIYGKLRSWVTVDGVCSFLSKREQATNLTAVTGDERLDGGLTEGTLDPCAVSSLRTELQHEQDLIHSELLVNLPYIPSTLQ